ncbi:MAG: adenylate/guanylate cyclase domain-containing protein [Alphaproteobacteria bacterium]|nr:adenylate/guanylate cyclase domain-containing protein [Alphaproteobacteria bacterium]
MTLSRRARREWRFFLWFSVASAAISAYFGYAVGAEDESAIRGASHGVLASLLIATPITFIEIRGRRIALLRRLRRLPWAAFFTIKALFYAAVIVGGLLLMRVLTHAPDEDPFAFTPTFRGSIAFAIAMSLLANLIVETGGLLGFSTLKNILTGRYVHPRREQKAFLLIDMRDSTGLAERLGPIRFHELLNSFFRDIAEAAFESEAEIHKYVGDEAILTWPIDAALADGECLACPFLARDLIARNAEHYRKRYGAVPTFRAALHCGEIVAGEIGDVRREIAYVGDTLNVAARLLEAAKGLGHDILVSQDLLQIVKLPSGLEAMPLPTLAIRGRTAPLGISALSRVGED